MWPNSQETVDLAAFTKEILNGKLHFWCSVKTQDLRKQGNLRKISKLKACLA